MSRVIHYFESSGGGSVVSLPFAVDEVVAAWSGLRATMARRMPESFTRDEWAYLISFLDPTNLSAPYKQTFGEPAATGSGDIDRFFRPRGMIGVWLPGNVSLLGPLTMVLLSLSGNAIRLKGAAGAANLTDAFLEFARAHLADGALREYLERNVRFEVFDRADERNLEMAALANVRIVFGSDEAARAVHSLDHPVDSVGISFADRQSEAWIEREAVSDTLLTDLIKVFAIYGQAGCTSPRRVVLLGAASGEVRAIRDRVQAMWRAIVRGEPAPHVVSENVMSRQCAAALGWDAVLAPLNAATLACGSVEMASIPGQMSLTFVPADLEQAIDTLPDHIQTIGYGVKDPVLDQRWWDLLGRTAIERLVPLRQMHHFGPVWDGQAYWRQTFDEVEVSR